MDLVDAVYSRMTASDRSAERVPKALFRYYCAIMWWCRVLWLKKSNARILSTSEEDLLDLSSLEMSLPSAIAQYLANVGIFKHGDEQFYFDFQSTDFSGTFHHLPFKEGWPVRPHGIMTPSEFWIYAHVPVPGVYALSVVNEAANSGSGSPQIQNLSFLCPATTDTVDEWVPNANINGWDVTKDPCLHSS